MNRYLIPLKERSERYQLNRLGCTKEDIEGSEKEMNEKYQEWKKTSSSIHREKYWFSLAEKQFRAKTHMDPTVHPIYFSSFMHFIAKATQRRLKKESRPAPSTKKKKGLLSFFTRSSESFPYDELQRQIKEYDLNPDSY